ncbi:hypothetical protein [Streptomyces griseocarneus]|uniref:hypothetical protein n=1 Tax=Streptomyces griseocarneus TaxID=51201 RepID=UPI00167E2561|nr:hypothetical protein [Streptomyces griseocarneus]MBZ6475263.1 hypothetical protein [Streptomyces griseocarneus]GHG61365.1 methyltransferase type 12 [Streptomyces griseocarneus]
MTADAGEGHGWGKSGFEDVYDRPDPRAYFTRLRPLDYRIPHHAQPVYRALVEERARRARSRPPAAVVDLCCSYGVNAALLNHDLTLADLYAHYTSPEAATLTTAELTRRDKEFYAAHRRADAVPVIGVDVSSRAVGYARDVGLLDDAFAVDLETDDACPGLARALGNAWLITVTGGLSYIGPRTFGRVLAHAPRDVRVAAFALRTVDYGPIAAVLRDHGLVTETSAELHPQRRFTDDAEQRRTVDRLTALGMDAAGYEAEGYYYARYHYSRPVEDVAR